MALPLKNKVLKKTELQRLLSKRGFSSRSAANKLIKEGKVKVDGKVVKDPLAYISLQANITVEDVVLPKESPDPKILVLFHKPKGVITTLSDDKNRKTVYDVLPNEYHHLKPVGRLDMATTGLLLFTNDSYLADKLLDPKNKIQRTYVVTVKGLPSEEKIKKLCSGIKDQKDFLHAKSIEARKLSGKESILIVSLEEGKNREIRRMFEAINHQVIKLKRISFGEIELNDLPVGKAKVIPIPANLLNL